MVMVPLTILNSSWMHLDYRRQAIGGAGGVRNDVAPWPRCTSPGSRPVRRVMSSLFAGAEMTTFFTVLCKCFLASLASVNFPVDSITICTPTNSQSQFGRILVFEDLIFFPSTDMLSPSGVYLVRVSCPEPSRI